jgi:hypothetical protein
LFFSLIGYGYLDLQFESSSFEKNEMLKFKKKCPRSGKRLIKKMFYEKLPALLALHAPCRILYPSKIKINLNCK